MIHGVLGKTGLKVSSVGLGMEHLSLKNKGEILPVIHEALDQGINYFDLIVSNPEVKDLLGKGFAGKRDRLILAGHLGLSERDGQYYKTRDRNECLELVDDLLRRLDTDHLDILHLHNVDEEADYQQIIGPTGILELAECLKKHGKTRFIGLSGHNVAVAEKAVLSGLIDVLMHPVNIAWDAAPGRKDLFYHCAIREVGLVGMKTFAGGEIFQARPDASQRSITPVQCISYTLSQPGVATVPVGVKNVQELKMALQFLNSTETEKDFHEMLGGFQRIQGGTCVYCNHCLPCPSLIDIGEALKLFHTAQIELTGRLQAEYLHLPVKPDACIECGECMRRCPFGVDVMDKLKAMKKVFSAQDHANIK